MKYLVCLFGLTLFAFSNALHAHDPGMSRGDYQLDGQILSVELSFAQSDFVASFPNHDLDGNGALNERERDGVEVDSALVFDQILSVSAPSPGAAHSAIVACQLVSSSAFFADPIDINLRAIYECAGESKAVETTLLMINRLPFGHRHLAYASGSLLAVADRRMIAIVHTPVTRSNGNSGGALQLVAMGAMHIAEGADHVLFVLVMLLASQRRRDLIAAVTAFTVGHSISLAIVSTGLWLPSPDWVEPVIALTIALSGLQLIGKRSLAHIGLPVFCIGLIHGLGFGAAVQELSAAKATPILSVFAFNVGVELGQLAILLIGVPIWQVVKRHSTAALTAKRGIGGLVSGAGIWWFLTRASLI